MSDKVKRTVYEYFMITVATLMLVVGVYVFKFPNNFTFGGVTGVAVLLEACLPFSASVITSAINLLMLVFGFIFLGLGFGFKTVYVTIINTLGLYVMEKYFPMDAPLTDQPVLELIFAIVLPAVSSAILFNMEASGGGTDIAAMILNKYIKTDIGKALFIVDAVIVVICFFIYGVETGLFSTAGLLAKTLVIDGVIENINLSKCFTIICDDPNPIVEFIHNELGRTATTEKAKGTFLDKDKTVILVVTKRRQAVRLRNFIKRTEPTAFIMINNSSEIIGKGFRGFN